MEQLQFNERHLEILNSMENLVNSMSYKNVLNEIMTPDDLKQQYLMVIWEMMPKLETLDKDEMFSFVKAVLKNETNYWIRHYSIRTDSSTYAKEAFQDISMSEYYGDGADVNTFTNASKFLKPEEYTIGNELKEIILDWAEGEDYETRLYINEAINTSDATANLYEEMLIERKRESTKDYIPPMTLSRMLKISDKKYYKIINSLKSYLESVGYKVRD